jgi:TonB family protein
MERMIGLLFFITLISGCATTSTGSTQQGTEPALAQEPITNQVPRTIVIDGQQVTENKVGEFISWGCGGFIQPNNVLIEVGIFSNPELSGEGFILFDGGDTGEFAWYRREGINHRWSWGPNGNDYSFVINPHGGGLYYDFTNAKGGKTEASDVFTCERGFSKSRENEEAEFKSQLAAEQEEQRAHSALEEYIPYIQEKVQNSWLRPAGSPPGLSCVIQATLIPGGEVVGTRIVQSSGNDLFDESVERAVQIASPLPLPADPALFKHFREIDFNFSPD